MDRIDALRLFVDVVEAGSFSAVARQRTIATSTVTLAVRQLEQETAARLMVRSTRRLVLTREGEMLLADARRIVAEWDGALSGLRQDGPLAGPIRVAATNDFGRIQLRPLLDGFQQRHPGIHITLLLSDSTIDVVDERIDLALRSGPLPDSSLRARRLLRGKRLVCAAPGYWTKAGRPARPEQLAGHNCLVLARPGAPLAAWAFQDGARQFSVKVAGDRQASNGDVIREWALAGLGVAFKNAWDVRHDLVAGRLETALDDFAADRIDLYAVQPGGLPSRRVAALVEFLDEALNDPG
ncbi:LysR family transcriptional regulator [Pseudoduganella albidiflava]|uniref:Transcriptional regulator n=1 Tax=Pseudoduganella albidiflava TaxID=321983 RepID=A0A411WUF4_9BURK|nr:LysR family transcriptional regulator [Pseudoduganella albidiflava]QBI00411.1 LysR family transcriptional regulator [Pseudoduganella albidiflava]GGY53708.1 transcriptional regulator [Pseudoduganella albidiflava]